MKQALRAWALIALAAALPAAASLCTVRPAHAEWDCFAATITAYDQESWPGRMADGNYTGDYVGEAVAASADIPMHASVWIEDLGTFTKRDTGGGLYWHHIDYLVWTYAEAIEFGRQYRTVCVEGEQ